MNDKKSQETVKFSNIGDCEVCAADNKKLETFQNKLDDTKNEGWQRQVRKEIQGR